MSDGDRSVVVPMGSSSNPPEQLPAYDDFTDAEERPATDFAPGLVNLGFITAALRRGAWLWCTTAVAGLLIGLGVYLAVPPSYQASTSVLLSPPPGQNPTDSIVTDAALAHSRTVAGLALRRLGLRQSVTSFLGTYTVTVVTNEVLLITFSAPSSEDAVRRASTVATGFLRFRADQMETEQNLVLKSLNQQIDRAKQHIDSINKQISQLLAQPASPAQQARLNSLRNTRSRETTALTTLVQTTDGNQATTQAATTSTVQGSHVLDTAAPIPQSRRSRLKHLLGIPATGLIAGLALGLGIVTVRALVSDRLRRRDDVADALGAPIKLSVGAVRVSRWLPSRREQGRDLKRMVAYLRDAMPARSRGAAALAVVTVDNARAVAPSLVSLAVSYAQEGKQVVVADLTDGAPAARLLGAGKPGIRPVRVNGAHLVVAVPGRDNVVPVGPLQQTSRAQPAMASEALIAAHASADVMLTLVALDPALGAEHIASWATGAVVVVTAGRSSWTKVHAVGEMIQLANMRLISGVLVGADKTDESLGVIHTPEADSDADPPEEASHSDGEGFVVTVEGGPSGGAARKR